MESEVEHEEGKLIAFRLRAVDKKRMQGLREKSGLNDSAIIRLALEHFSHALDADAVYYEINGEKQRVFVR